MPVNPELLGRAFPATAPIEVTAASVHAFATAVLASDPDASIAPPTYPIVVQQAALDELLADPSTGIVLSRVVHGEQRFATTRDIVIGDVLTGELTVTAMRALGPATMLTAETVVRDAAGEQVATATSVLVIGEEDAA
ncbi:MAG TPA: MaoC family dehydratase N-terminal domain-containing protein [Microbacteriaceae bacterium]|nr:MaoC family dehydratase N-terminal domain-containing protein [Microbacteriaceae bacterium]